MAASEVGICNLALSHLGDSATVASISPPEGSAQAEHCERFYPTARDTLLEMHDWGFATRRAAPAALAVAAEGWRHAYALPADFIRLIGMPARAPDFQLPDGTERLSTRYEQDPTRWCSFGSAGHYAVEAGADGAPVLYASGLQSEIRYVARVTDPTRFSPLFADALTWLLASYLAGPVLKGETGAAAGRTAYAVFLRQFALARTSDANQSRAHRADAPVPGWMAAR